MSKKAKFAGLLNEEETPITKKKEDVLNSISSNTEIQKTVNTPEKKKVTYELNIELHKKLKLFAAMNDKTMTQVVESAVKKYIEDHKIQEIYYKFEIKEYRNIGIGNL
ncbi:hypothetical protein NLX67_08110 [Domibacillus sp. A3M-37]|uniref:hypothetical protein n=1 Tax=Domibacillus sp. A3M-37 TaxID=2962037 RepID=UPI0020B76C20|nr:hypothetical protein [Domibacillus sp. A3M-37]MCP3762352.1 hypothetical protein [Domibacillus sp. A3M-37]